MGVYNHKLHQQDSTETPAQGRHPLICHLVVKNFSEIQLIRTGRNRHLLTCLQRTAKKRNDFLFERGAAQISELIFPLIFHI